MPLQTRSVATGALLLAVSLSSCQTYDAPAPSTYEEREASARRLREIEDENFRYRDRERRSAARAGATTHYLGDPGTTGAQPVW